jgi:hypothetical protein
MGLLENSVALLPLVYHRSANYFMAISGIPHFQTKPYIYIIERDSLAEF